MPRIVLKAGLGWAGLGWAGLGWAGLGWAGLGESFGRINPNFQNPRIRDGSYVQWIFQQETAAQEWVFEP